MLRTQSDLEGFFFKNDRNILIFWSLYHLDKWIRLRKKKSKKKWLGNPILGHFPPKYAQNCLYLKGYISLSYQLTIKWFGHSIVYRIPDQVTESFFDSPGARGVNPPPPWGVFEVKIFRKGIGYLNHCRFSPTFPGSVFGPRVEKKYFILLN